HGFHATLITLGTLLCTAVSVNSQSCILSGCGSSPLRCGPNSTIPSCNFNTGQCYCLDYQCDNLDNNCSSTACGVLEKGQCVLDVADCDLAVNQADIQRFDNICGNLGSAYFALSCSAAGQCRCGKKIDGCRTNADCTCLAWGEDTCDTASRTCRGVCECSSDSDCAGVVCPADKKNGEMWLLQLVNSSKLLL
ncbi:hypothetical protein Fcan01_16225, partial [Folsomia candida]